MDVLVNVLEPRDVDDVCMYVCMVYALSWKILSIFEVCSLFISYYEFLLLIVLRIRRLSE